MTIDDLKSEWSAASEQSGSPFGVRPRRVSMTARVRRSLRWLTGSTAIELVLNLLAVVALGDFIAGHVSEPRFLIPAFCLDIAAIAIVISNVRQLVKVSRVDFGATLIRLQTDLGAISLERVRVTLGTLLVAPLCWTPLLIVGLAAIGVDAYAALGTSFLLANLIFGAAVIPAAIWGSRRYAPVLRGSPLLRSLAEQISGYNLQRAKAALVEFSEMEETA